MVSLWEFKTDLLGCAAIQADSKPGTRHSPRAPNAGAVHVERAADLFVIEPCKEAELDDSCDIYAELSQLL